MSVCGEALSAITGMEEACATARARVEDLIAETDDLRRCLISVIAQRDEAQERANTLAINCESYFQDSCRMRKERDEARAEVERLRTALLEVQTSESAAAWFADGFHDGWKIGAEAMREACARWMSEREGISQWVYDDALSALPIPEEP